MITNKTWGTLKEDLKGGLCIIYVFQMGLVRAHISLFHVIWDSN